MLALAPQAGAQEATPPTPVPASGEAVLLDPISVISRTGETAIESMASVSVVDEEAIARKMATTPLGLFRDVPGISIQADAKRSNSSINIRGLQDFGRVQVIVDGARQNFQRSGHGTQSVFWIDPLLLQQAEVIRGPVANTYGSGAIGGVVMFETKDASDFLRDWERWAFAGTGQYESNGDGWTTSAIGAARINENIDVLGNIVWRDYGSYEDGAGIAVPHTGFDVLSGMVKTSIRPTDNSEVKLGWIGTDDGWSERSGNSDLDLAQNTFTGRYHVTDAQESWLDLHLNTSLNMARLEQTYRAAVGQFDVDTGRPVTIPAGAKTNYDLDTYGIDLWNTSRFETGMASHELTYGGDWLKDEVVTSSPLGGSDFYTPSGSRQTWGAYIQEKLGIGWFEAIAGLRYDSYELSGTNAESSGERLSPRLTLGVSPFSGEAWGGLKIYGTYAEGYRSPTLSETLISGLHPSGVVFPFLPNPDLEPEVGKTWELGVNYRRDGLFRPDDRLRIKAAYYRNNVEDFIDGQQLSPFDPTSGCPLRADLFRTGSYAPICFQYQNFAKAKLWGWELEGTYDAGWVFAGANASFTEGYRVAEGAKEDITTLPSSKFGGHLGFRLLEERLSFGGEVEHHVAPDSATFAKDYTLVNAFAQYDVNENFSTSLRAENLFDVRYANPLNATTTSIVHEPGLSVKLAATLRFGG
ncbi:TonB-dependent receptor domain-containing protein [Afifella pfennigii]|uniref:TonB-dependent receptor domain-containing protein n=1 Tax=Afifella pfennigii TaxID=209897 RepID=UPI002ADDFA73|nr:TonB-dependent receptor [Afifella pfennigii]